MSFIEYFTELFIYLPVNRSITADAHLLGNFFSGVYDLDKSIRSIRIYWFLIQWPREVSDMFMTPTQPLSTTGREYAKEIKEAWQEAFQ